MDTTKQRHLIERAAARLDLSSVAGAELRPPSPQPNWQPPIGRERESSEAAEHTNNAKRHIELTALTDAGLLESESYSRTAEEFRIVQNRLLREGLDKRAAAPGRERDNLVMVTSALKGEGKSFAAINLAGEVARHSDRRVLLIDADPKAFGLRHGLGVSDAKGLLDLARDKRLDLADVIIPTAAEYLDILSLGGADEKASGELFASQRMNDVIVEIGRRCADRLVIFDTPPCLSSSIPHILANLVGHTVLVVGADSTQQKDIEAALDFINVCPKISALLNKIPTWVGYSFGSYDYLSSEI